MCHHGFSYARGRFMKCHGFGPHCTTEFTTPVTPTLRRYICAPSINIQNQDMQLMYGNHVKSFGLGDFMGYDLPTGKSAFIKNIQNLSGGWRSTTIVSNAIGQGKF
jgi:penicillin-binding protein 2